MSTAIRSRPTHPADIPTTFDGLMKLHALRPIHDDIELEQAGEMVEMLAGHDLNSDQEDYLDVLATLIEAYEERHHPIDLSDYEGIMALRALLDDQKMSQTDLAALLGIHKSHVSKIMKGERSLTTEHLRILAERFRVNPLLFIGTA